MKETKEIAVVSVIIAVHNSERFISETLESLITQTYPHTDIIVIDDGSTDQTQSIVLKYKSKVRYFYQNQSGVSIARNYGILKSLGEYLCFMDADDIASSNRIELQINFLEKNPDIKIVFSDYRNFDKNGIHEKSHFESCPLFYKEITKNSLKQVAIENACLYLAKENFGIAGSFMTSKQLLKFLAHFEPTLRGGEDFHFYYRLCQHTKVGIINEVGMLRRLHDSNVSSQKDKIILEYIRSRMMIRRIEKDRETKYYLNIKIASFFSDLASYYAHNKEWTRAIYNALKALYIDFNISRLFLFFNKFLKITFIKMVGSNREISI